MLVFQGRIHYYEGYDWERATATVQLAYDLGARSLLLTNAAGAIHESLVPGDLMVIRDHITLLGPEDWKSPRPQPVYDIQPFTNSGLAQGTYAALTGPSYETPAEIRALKIMGVDVVGMSTAREAERAKALGMKVFAVSCVTNKAAGISTDRLDHREVQQVAGRIEIVEKFANILDELFVNLKGNPLNPTATPFTVDLERQILKDADHDC